MQLPANSFLAGLKSGTPQIGLWVSLATPYVAEVVAGSGFDWFLLDTEHAPGDIPSVVGQLQVLAAYEGTAIVRPAWNDTVLVKRLLDAGAPGLLFPMVQTPHEAASAVAATRYPPRGVRGVSGMTRATRFGRITDYFQRVEDETAVLVQVETRAALQAATDIAATDGVDGVFFGPADIAADMGLMGQLAHDDLWAAIMAAAKPLMAQGIPVGTLVFDTSRARRLIDQGFAFVACGTDATILSKGADALNKAMRA